MSSQRAKRKSSKSPNTKESGNRDGSKQRDTDHRPAAVLPLAGKVIYLDIQKRTPKMMDKLKSDLMDLGARVEPFLSKEITNLISDRPEAKDFSKSQGYPSGASPAVSTPSPFQQGKDSGAADSPDVSNTLSMVTRGRAIANKADTSSRAQGSTDVLNNARNMGIPVTTLDRILTYIQKEKAKLVKTGHLPKEKGETSGSRSKKKERKLQRYYLKVEDKSRRFRPQSSEMDVWPRVQVDSGVISSPFVERVPSRVQQRGALQPGPSQATAPAAKSPERRHLSLGEKKAAGRKQKSPPKRKGTEKVKGGYCECCRGRYSDIDEHVESSGHQAFVQNKDNYSSLDAMISEGPNMEQFLNDCLMYHVKGLAAQNEGPEEGDEVVLISEAPQVQDVTSPTRNHPSKSSPKERPHKQKSPGQKTTPKQKVSTKPSTPKKKATVRASKRRRSSSPVYQRGSPSEGEKGERKSPRLRSQNSRFPATIVEAPQGGKQRQDGDDLQEEEHLDNMVEQPAAGDNGDRIAQNVTEEGVPIVSISNVNDKEEQNTQKGKEDASFRSPKRAKGSSAVTTPLTPRTPVSPRSRLSLTRRKRRALLDMSPAADAPPGKKKKQTNEREGTRLGVIDAEVVREGADGEGTRISPRRRKENVDTQGDPQDAQRSPSPIFSTPSRLTRKLAAKCTKPDECQATEKEVEREMSESVSHSVQNEDVGGHAKSGKVRNTCSQHSKHFLKPQMTSSIQSQKESDPHKRRRCIVGSPTNSSLPSGHNQENASNTTLCQGNSNFPQGTTNTSTGQPFLGHSHTDFGLNPKGSRVGRSQSDITGSEDEHLRTIFRSDPTSERNFEGFSNEEIHESEMQFDSSNQVEHNVLKEKLKKAALDVVYVPSSELDARVEDGSDSESVSSEKSVVEVDIVLQNVENFPSEGSEWETQVHGFMTKLDEALEVREKQTIKLREELEKKKSELDKKRADLENDSLKENQGAAGADQIVVRNEEMGRENVPRGEEGQNLSSEGKEKTHSQANCGVSGEHFDEHRRESIQRLTQKKQHQLESAEDERPSKNPVFESPPSKQALKEISNTDPNSKKIHKPPVICSTPKLRRKSADKNSIPHVTFSPKISVEDQDIILENYIHDCSEREISFPKLSSPAQEGWRVSPVKHVLHRSDRDKPSTPTKAHRPPMRRRSFSGSEVTRPMLFLRLKVSPSSRRHSLPNFPVSPPPSPFKSPKQGSPSKRSPPIFALLYDDGNRKKGLTPILVTNRRPNFSREILQPSLRLSLSKRRARRSASLDKQMPRTLAALNLSLPHIFDVFEFHDEESCDEQEAGENSPGMKKVKTVECGTQTPPRRKRGRGRSLSFSGKHKGGRLKHHPARRRLCVSTEPEEGVGFGEASTSGYSQSNRTGQVQASCDAIGSFEGSNLAAPFDLPLSFYM